MYHCHWPECLYAEEALRNAQRKRTEMKHKIVYILGSGHSGSTLLDLMLGSHPSIESVGELHTYGGYFSPNTERPDSKRICTCGVHVLECEYWKAVRADLVRKHGTDQFDVNATDGREFAEANSRVISAVLDHSGKHVLVDSSKSIKRLRRLIACNDFEMFVFHIVRDGRAVAYSALKKGRDLQQALAFWCGNSGWADELQMALGKRYAAVRYEDLVAAPKKCLTRLLSVLGLEFDAGMPAFQTHVHHNISGNRMRMRCGQMVQRDTEYLDAIRLLPWLRLTWQARRALRRFSYPLRRR